MAWSRGSPDSAVLDRTRPAVLKLLSPSGLAGSTPASGIGLTAAITGYVGSWTRARKTRASVPETTFRQLLERARDLGQQSRLGGVEGRLVLRDESRLMREHDRLHAVAQVELLEDVRDVRLDRRVADVELLADLRVGKAARY